MRHRVITRSISIYPEFNDALYELAESKGWTVTYLIVDALTSKYPDLRKFCYRGNRRDLRSKYFRPPFPEAPVEDEGDRCN